MNGGNWAPAGSDSAHVYATTALSVFWPRAEYHALIARWPRLSAHVGDTWDEHRRRVERHCVLVERNGLRVSQVAGEVDGFAAFLAANGAAKPSEDDLLAYPDMRTVAASSLASWPPARNAPCWCGSGAQYKRCCRPHGLGTID